MTCYKKNNKKNKKYNNKKQKNKNKKQQTNKYNHEVMSENMSIWELLSNSRSRNECLLERKMIKDRKKKKPVILA